MSLAILRLWAREREIEESERIALRFPRDTYSDITEISHFISKRKKVTKQIQKKARKKKGYGVQPHKRLLLEAD